MRNSENYWKRLKGRRYGRRGFLVAGGVTAAGAAAILAGCGDDDEAAPAAATAAATKAAATQAAATEAAAEATAAATAAATEPPPSKRGGTLRLHKGTEGSGFDPGMYHLDNTEITHWTFTQPLAYQPTKGTFSMDGMTSFEQADDMTLIWKVRPGMTFHNGDPVTAEDVAYSWNRLGQIYDLTGGTHVSRPGFAYWDNVEAIDNDTVVEHWKKPSAGAPIHRSRHYYSFINKAVAEAKGNNTGDYIDIQSAPDGVGSGPYRIAEANAEGTRLTRWEDYWKHTPADDGFVEDGPYIDEIVTRIIPDKEAVRAAFEAGDMDVYSAIDGLMLEEFEGNPRVNIQEVPSGGNSFLGMDGTKLFDTRARQALQKGFNYPAFIASIRAGEGMFQAPVSTLLGGFQQLSQTDLQKWYTYDPAEARKLWEAAAPEIGEKLHIRASSSSPLQTDISNFVGQTYKESLGLDPEITITDVGTWASAALVRPEKDWELLMYGDGLAGGTTGLPEDSSLIHFDPRGYGLNAFNHHADPDAHPVISEQATELAGMLDAQQAETDMEARAALLTEIQTWILDRHWCNAALPVPTKSYYGFGSRLRDFGADNWLNFYAHRRESMWLDQA